MDRIRSTAVAVAVLVTTAIATPAVAGVAVAQQDQQTDECTTINESGTYELNASIGETNASANATLNATNESLGTDGATANESGLEAETNDSTAPVETGNLTDDVNASACIVIEASDVTFDGNGHTLNGANPGQLNLSGDDSVDVTNASADANETVVNGIVVRPATGNESVSNVTITNVTVENWYVGVYIQNASGVTLDNVTFANNTVPGFRLVNSTDLTIRNVNQSAAQSD